MRARPCSVIVLGLLLGACERRTQSVSGDGLARAAALASIKAKLSASAPHTADIAPPSASAHESGVGDAEPAQLPQPPKALAANEKDDHAVTSSHYWVDAAKEVGPAAPAAAFAGGVVMITRSDELAVAPLTSPPSKAKKAVSSQLEATTRPAPDFFSVARGPAVSATHAYWVSKGRVVRRAFAGGELEVLTTDARDGTRVAVAGSPDVVAYITQAPEKQDPKARLRLADGKKLDLTPEGAAASSVTLANVGEDVVVGYIDGRSGMTPVHARRLRTKASTLDPDVVVWVSGATQGLTEMVSVGTDDSDWLMLPVERDASHFGLATLLLGKEPKMDPPLRWRTFANGLDRSPVAAGMLCGAPVAAYVRPVDETPESNQELVLSSLTLDETASSEQVATARGFADVSLYPLPQGALLAYVADRRTWARLIRCK